MAEQPESKDFFTRLAGVGEDAIQKIADMPGLSKLTESVNTLRNRVDDLQKRVRGLDELEQRLGELETRVNKLEGKPQGASRSRTTRSGAGTSASKPKTKPPTGES
jgi:polyhydroxyalkanoate synthesis regulator phasin